MPKTKLVLFDIDGTLVLTGRAGVRAMNRACQQVIGECFGQGGALEGIAVAGRTDWVILHDALRAIGHEMDEDLFVRLRDAYVSKLSEEIVLPGQGVKAVMPGIRELLDALNARPDVFLALLTGNFEQGARIKLEHFNLWHYFRCGAFGDDAADRNALVPFAVERARSCGLERIAPDAVFVVGDTPHDVACARASSAVPVGVATGSFSVSDLRASGAEIVFADLSDTMAFLRVIDREASV
jgi:phosphoglycolate phosphatase-like HAD superfamily hydrolase